MWHINRKPMKSSIQICQLNAHLTVSSWKWQENRFFNCFIEGSRSTPNGIGSWFSTWTLVLTYFRILNHKTRPKTFIFNFSGSYPLGGPECLPPWKYENIGQTQCPCRKSASYLIRCVHTPINKTVIKKTIYRSFSAADGQIRGQMNIWLTYLNRAFHGLSIDISYDPRLFFNFLGGYSPW